MLIEQHVQTETPELRDPRTCPGVKYSWLPVTRKVPWRELSLASGAV